MSNLNDIDRKLDEIDMFLMDGDDLETLKRKVIQKEKQIRSLQTKINLATVELDSYINFCKNDSRESFEICNIVIKKFQKIKEILKR